jgi:hypothetical protein
LNDFDKHFLRAAISETRTKGRLIPVDRTPAENWIFLGFQIKGGTIPILTFPLAERFVLSGAIKHVLTRMGQLFRTGNPPSVAFSRRERTSTMHNNLFSPKQFLEHRLCPARKGGRRPRLKNSEK